MPSRELAERAKPADAPHLGCPDQTPNAFATAVTLNHAAVLH